MINLREKLIKLGTSKLAVLAGCSFLFAIALAFCLSAKTHGGQLSVTAVHLVSLPVTFLIDNSVNNIQMVGIMEVNNIETVWTVLIVVVFSCTLGIAWFVGWFTSLEHVIDDLPKRQRDGYLFLFSLVPLIISLAAKTCVRLFQHALVIYSQGGDLSYLALSFVVQLALIFGSIAQWSVLFSGGYLIGLRYAKKEPIGWLPVSFLLAILPLLRITR